MTHESFLGITCVWYSVSADSETIGPTNSRSSRILHCSQGNNTAFLSSREKVSDSFWVQFLTMVMNKGNIALLGMCFFFSCRL